MLSFYLAYGIADKAGCCMLLLACLLFAFGFCLLLEHFLDLVHV